MIDETHQHAAPFQGIGRDVPLLSTHPVMGNPYRIALYYVGIYGYIPKNPKVEHNKYHGHTYVNGVHPSLSLDLLQKNMTGQVGPSLVFPRQKSRKTSARSSRPMTSKTLKFG